MFFTHDVVQMVTGRAEHAEEPTESTQQEQEIALISLIYKWFSLIKDEIELVEEVEAAYDMCPSVDSLIMELER